MEVPSPTAAQMELLPGLAGRQEGRPREAEARAGPWPVCDISYSSIWESSCCPTGWSLSHAVSYCPGYMELSSCWWWSCRDVRAQRLCLRVRHPSSTHPIKGQKLTVTRWARADLEPNRFASPEARLSVDLRPQQWLWSSVMEVLPKMSLTPNKDAPLDVTLTPRSTAISVRTLALIPAETAMT